VYRDYMHIPSEDTPGLAIGDRSGLGDAAADWAALAKLTPAQRQQLVEYAAAKRASVMPLPPMTAVQKRFYAQCIGTKTDPYAMTACAAEALKVQGQKFSLGAIALPLAIFGGAGFAVASYLRRR
jgi:hypothetical protein